MVDESQRINCPSCGKEININCGRCEFCHYRIIGTPDFESKYLDGYGLGHGTVFTTPEAKNKHLKDRKNTIRIQIIVAIVVVAIIVIAFIREINKPPRVEMNTGKEYIEVFPSSY